MDAYGFDALVRILSAPGSRRRALTLVLSGALASLLARGDATAHDALRACKKKSGKQKKKCLKKAKQHNAHHVNETPAPTDPTCLGPGVACAPPTGNCCSRNCGCTTVSGQTSCTCRAPDAMCKAINASCATDADCCDGPCGCNQSDPTTQVCTCRQATCLQPNSGGVQECLIGTTATEG